MTPPDAGGPGGPGGEAAHFAALERLYAAAPINRLFPSRLMISRAGEARIDFRVTADHFHAAGAAHGTSYFKMLDDAAFYAANSLVSDRFLLTTGMTLFFTSPVQAGELSAHGRWVSGRRRVLVAESRLEQDGEEVGRATGTFLVSRIPLADLPGYRAP